MKSIILFLTVTLLFSMASASAQQGNYLPVNGIRMYYEIHGTGHPLVLIHGGGSTLYTTFGKILPLLSQKYKVIGVELQAHGHTSDRNAPETFEQDADDVAELLKQLNISNADIFGFSNGGNTAMQMAIRHPERVRKLIIASAFYKREGMQPWFWDFMKDANINHMPHIYKDVFLEINPGNLDGLQAMHDKDLRRMQTFKDWKDSDLKSIKAPALLIVGDQDAVRIEHAIEMHHLLANSRLTILPATHGSYIAEIMTPETDIRIVEGVVAMIEEFLTQPIIKSN